MIRRYAGRVAVLAVVAGLVLVGCSGGKREVPAAGGNAELGSTSDINPQDPATLQKGGNLRLALSSFPSNFNTLNIDGNEADTGSMLRATMPRAFVIAADGSMKVNTDYFTNVELTGTNPQVVKYTINPKATWSDGTPITWEDIAAQINATSGKDKAFAIAAPNGSDRVGSVTRGADDRQAIITFAKPYAEWRGMFAGNTMLLPKSMTANPDVFNKGQLNGPGPSAGPFIVSALDRTAQRIVLTRNPKWWGTPPLLDSITYLVLDDAARIPALQNNAIDATGLSSLDDLTIARNTAGISIRRAPGLSWYHFTFNGAPGSILADKALRLAIAKGIDRQAIAELERFDGKFVVHSNDDTLTAEDMALGYKQQQRVEEAWRTMKGGLRMRPVFHWAPHRIHAHIAITVLSLLLERVIEHACQDTWRNVRDDLKRIQLAQLSSPNGTVWQVTEPTAEAANRLKALKIKPPPAILRLD